MIGSTSSRLRDRAPDALLGAACGAIVAAAIIGSQVPRLGEAHTKLLMVVCTILGAVLALTGQLRRVGFVLVPVAAIALFVMLTPVMSGPVHRWVRSDSIPTTPLDAVVVLSASVHADSSLNAPAVERLIGGISLVRATKTRLLLTTRVRLPMSGDSVSTDRGQRRLITSLTDSVDWRILSPVGTTRDEAVRAAALLHPLGKRRIAVVTSPMHTRRACATFEAVGFQTVCVASEEWTYSVGNLEGPYDRMRAFFDYVYERLGMLKYRSRGWLPAR